MATTNGWILLFLLGSALYATAQLQEAEPQAVEETGAAADAGSVVPVGPPPNLAQDLMDIYRLIQFKQMDQLFVRYLLNDAQFQAFVRIMNSNAGFTARWRLLSQPELVLFRQWVNQQIMASGGKLKIKEMELCMTLNNQYPYWSGTVYGWQGFVSEMEMYFPQYAIQAQVQAKVQLQGIFAQFWTRLQSLQVVYERWLTLPATQTVLAQLQAEGIDNAYLDRIIRELFGWNAVNGTATTTIAPAVLPAANTLVV